MAELITTDEEKAAKSYLDWDDASIGRLVRYGAAHLRAEAKKDEAEGNLIRGHSALIYLIEQMLAVNAETTTMTVKDLRIGKKVLGDFKLTLERETA